MIVLKYPLFLLALLSICTVCGQSFEGKIQYKVQTYSKDKSIATADLQKSLGSWQTYQFRGKDFLMTNNGKMLVWQLYKADEGKVYQRMDNQSKVYFLDAARITDEVQKIDLLPNEITVLGKRCKGVRFQKYSGTFTYYYSTAYPILAENFQQLVFENWNQIFAAIQAVPLKIVVENEQFKVDITAYKVWPNALDVQQFILPDAAFIEASPY